MSVEVCMPKLTAEKLAEVRAYIRSQLESKGELKKGEPSKLRSKYGLSKSRIYSLVKEERERYKNPVGWEYSRRWKKGEKVNFAQLLDEYKDHPAFRNNQNPSNN